VIWIALAALALWWPSRVIGPLDGVPLDGAAEAILLGLVFPALCWLHRPFLNDRRARALILALVASKAVMTATLVQDGWCVMVIPSRPYVKDATGAPHSWDIRADWRSQDPSCTAIMTRPYTTLSEFPVWFFNLPPPTNSGPEPEDLPPHATTKLVVSGTLFTSRAGILQIATTDDVVATTRVDGQAAPPGSDGVQLAAGRHAIAVDATLTGNQWRLRPLWNGRDLWTQATATVTPPSTLDLFVRPWAGWVVSATAGILVVAWLIAALALARASSGSGESRAALADRWALAWMVTASGALALATATVAERRWHWAVAALAAAALLPLTTRVKNVRGAFLLIGVPWLVLVAVVHADQIGRMTLYSAGDDWWQFQRYAYRIVLQGYWLEGGERTFHFQPLYRWIAGVLHLMFGDSSIGEAFWDGACLVAMALFSFEVTARWAGFRWGIVSAALTLVLFMTGPGFIFIGRGLSEISSAGFIYLGALLVIRSRDGSWWSAVAAGVCATLGTFTRLNNLPMALAITVFAWPVVEPARMLWRPRALLARASTRTVTIVVATLVAGMLLFALRTWYYTGVVSVFLGTALDPERAGTARRVWRPGMSAGEGIAATVDSVMMVLTTVDPPRIHAGAIPILAAAAITLLAVCGVGIARQLPLGAALFFLSTLAGALVARGVAYSGRFSIPVIGAATTVFVCALSRAVSPRFWARSSDQES
jgi:hypothetical protein